MLTPSNRKVIAWCCAGAALAAVVWVAGRWPEQEFRAWTPRSHPAMTGVLTPNRVLEGVELLGGTEMIEPEDVAVDGWGRIYGACEDGRIRRTDAGGGATKVFADTRGRPLGMVFDAAGTLLVADAARGLLAVDGNGDIAEIVSHYRGKKILFMDDLDVDRRGAVYFSSVFDHTDPDRFMAYEILGRVPSGRLFRYHRDGHRLELLLDGLYFANGVALAHRGDFVLVAETADYSIRRYWLKGPKAGTDEIFASNLPGFPDNINRSSEGGFWIALSAPRDGRLDALLHPRPWLKKLYLALPAVVPFIPASSGLILHIDAQGAITRSLHDPQGRTIGNTTSANEHMGFLYLGHIYNSSTGIGRLDLERIHDADHDG